MPRQAAFESNPGYRLLAAQQDRRHHNDLAMLLTAEALLSRGWVPDRRGRRRLERLQRLATAA